jgi:plasmid stabilization system protein ParE
VTLALGWRDETVTDLLDIFDYIAERNITAADRLLAMIEHTTEHLPDHSYLHRPGRVSGTREAIVHPITSLYIGWLRTWWKSWLFFTRASYIPEPGARAFPSTLAPAPRVA